MPAAKPSLIARDDTFFGVCEGLGEDLGLPANALRIMFALALFWNPAASLGAYAGLGLVVALSRWIAPDTVSEAPACADEEPCGEEERPCEGYREAA